MLLALLPKNQRYQVIENLGLPGSIWPGILTVDELFAELNSIKKQRFCAIKGDKFFTFSACLGRQSQLASTNGASDIDRMRLSDCVLGSFSFRMISFYSIQESILRAAQK